MIIADLTACHRYYNLHPRMREMLEYIVQHDFSQQEAGHILLDGDNLFVNLDEVGLRTKEQDNSLSSSLKMPTHLSLAMGNRESW